MRHFLSMYDVTADEIRRIFAIAEDLKAKFEAGIRQPLLPGRTMALLFEKPSLRTRVSFEAAMTHLGGGGIFLSSDSGFGKRETVADFARVLGQYVDVIVMRAFQHATVVELARHATCPVINGLTDCAHPCQALGDLFTLREMVGGLGGQTLAFVGDGNNVARSLAVGCAKLGLRMVAVSPPGYELDNAFLARLRQDVPGCQIEVTTDAAAGVAGAVAVYTDVWASMGQESQRQQRQRDFAAYQVNAALMSHAPDDALVMHCLPARRGEEITDEVMDSPQSVVLQQAANRMHAQKGLLAWLLGSCLASVGTGMVGPLG